MIIPPTNYRMGSGLAGAIMGQSAALEQEKQGLENLYKGMEMPANMLKGQEAAMLMQNPEYLQQKVQNTMIDLKNQYSAADFQQTLNAANRVRIELDAAGGDRVKEQQIVQKSLAALKIDPASEFGQYAQKDPRGALTKFIEGVEAGLTGTGGAKHFGDMAKQRLVGEQGLEKQALANEGSLAAHKVTANASYAAQKYSTDKAVMVQAAGLAKNAEDNAAKYAEILRKLEPGVIDKQIAAKIKAANPELAQVEDTQLRDAMQAQLKYYQDEANRWKSYLPPMPRQPKIGGDQPAPTSGSPSLPPGVSVVTPK